MSEGHVARLRLLCGPLPLSPPCECIRHTAVRLGGIWVVFARAGRARNDIARAEEREGRNAPVPKLPSVGGACMLRATSFGMLHSVALSCMLPTEALPRSLSSLLASRRRL